MKCLILAAGYATRLYPLTANFPKPLLPIKQDATILDRLMEDLKRNVEIEEFIVVTNHKFVILFEAWKKEQEKEGYRITILDDGTKTNETRMGAVKDMELAVKSLNLTGDVLVMAGDNVLDFSLADFCAFAREKKTSCVMCHKEEQLEKQQKTAIITVDEVNRITSYEEKPQSPKGNLAVPPFYYYRETDIRRVSEALGEGCGYDAPGSFAAWLSRKTTMHAYAMPGNRYDIGDLKSYQKIQALLDGKDF